MLKPLKLDHLALKVTDMEKSLAFYQHVLGLEIVRRSGPNEAGGYAAVLRAGDQKLDLFSRPDFVSADKDKPVGMDHLCIQLDAASIDEVVADLRRAEVEIFWGPVEREGNTSVYIYDPDGMHVELRICQQTRVNQ